MPGDVIIADNDYIIRGILRSVLEAKGFTVLQAVDGLEAVNYAARTQARLAILDLRMPRADGVTASAGIRRLPGYRSVPIIMLTAFDDAATREAARAAGVTEFLTKPFKPVDLVQTIDRLLGAEGDVTPGSAPFVWQRRQEPPPLFGEPSELSEGRRILAICRR